MSNDLAEVWAPVPGYEGWYDVSACGQVMRVKYINGATPGKILRHDVGRRGYHQVRLNRGQGMRTSRVFKVHRLVAAAFLGPAPRGMQVNHKDGDKSNNHLSNLEYVTAKQNIHHAERMGLRPKRKGERHPMAKLTESDVVAIRRRRAQGEALSQLAAEFRVADSAISRIARRVTWRHI